MLKVAVDCGSFASGIAAARIRYPTRNPDKEPKTPKSDNSHRTTTITTTTFKIVLIFPSIGM